MPIVHTGETAYDHEMARWEQFPNRHTNDEHPPGNPYVFRPFPRMLYKAQASPLSGGQVKVAEAIPSRMAYDAGAIGDQRFQQAELQAMQFNASCQTIVRSEAEYAKARSAGWCDTPTAALAYHEGLQQDIARAAAEANHAVQRMTPKAKRGRKKREAAAGIAQVPE